jgi:hypothetical protein
MLVDSIEAGARTVEPPTRDKFLEMVQRVIFVKMHQGQLDESGLTISDIRTLAVQITEALVNAYHKRVRYPWQDAVERGEAPLPVTKVEPTPMVEPTETGKFRASKHDEHNHNHGEERENGQARREEGRVSAPTVENSAPRASQPEPTHQPHHDSSKE